MAETDTKAPAQKTMPLPAILGALEESPVDYSHFMTGSGDFDKLIINRSLSGKLRDFVIRIVKAPLEKAVIMAAALLEKKVGVITRENTVRKETHCILDIRDRFFEHYINPGKMDLFKAAFIILAFEIEHDSHYRWIFNWLLKMIDTEKAGGRWPRELGEFPQERCWKE